MLSRSCGKVACAAAERHDLALLQPPLPEASTARGPGNAAAAAATAELISQDSRLMDWRYGHAWRGIKVRSRCKLPARCRRAPTPRAEAITTSLPSDGVPDL